MLIRLLLYALGVGFVLAAGAVIWTYIAVRWIGPAISMPGSRRNQHPDTPPEEAK